VTYPLLAVVFGLALLVWGADRFVEGAVAAADHFGVPSLLIGMVIVGFGTSAPEMVVSALASLQGNPGIALGNAYGSNITNSGLILGITALVSPIAVHSQVLRKELPILIGVTVLSAVLFADAVLSRLDAVMLLAVFAGLMAWSIHQGMKRKGDALAGDVSQELKARTMPVRRAVFWIVAGLVLLIASSRILVWGAVEIARAAGIDDLVIGLTVVAVGTSLPELASSVIAARKKEHELALGNVLGSNLFNTLAVVGIAGAVRPAVAPAEILSRDILVMGLLSLSLFGLGYGFGGRPGRINRIEGGLLLLCWFGYTAYIVLHI
jgi:cation:H+ antiporter